MLGQWVQGAVHDLLAQMYSLLAPRGRSNFIFFGLNTECCLLDLRLAEMLPRVQEESVDFTPCAVWNCGHHCELHVNLFLEGSFGTSAGTGWSRALSVRPRAVLSCCVCFP